MIDVKINILNLVLDNVWVFIFLVLYNNICIIMWFLFYILVMGLVVEFGDFVF